MNYQQALNFLQSLFNEIGWAEQFQEALQQECRNAYLHGLADAAYDDWGDAVDLVEQVCEERRCFPCDLELWEVQKRFPTVAFRDSEFGYQFARGKLFSLRDYQLAKEAISAMGEDQFGLGYRLKFGKPVPQGTHLWED